MGIRLGAINQYVNQNHPVEVVHVFGDDMDSQLQLLVEGATNSMEAVVLESPMNRLVINEEEIASVGTDQNQQLVIRLDNGSIITLRPYQVQAGF